MRLRDYTFENTRIAQSPDERSSMNTITSNRVDNGTDAKEGRVDTVELLLIPMYT